MSVGSAAACPSLQGVEGELIAVRITIEPRLLEKLLDVLARLNFPINPQLYHDAATVSVYADGRRTVQPATVVEFPAWAGRLPQIREVLTASGFSEQCLTTTGMLENIRSENGAQPAPEGTPYKMIVLSKHALRPTA